MVFTYFSEMHQAVPMSPNRLGASRTMLAYFFLFVKLEAFEAEVALALVQDSARDFK